MLVPGGTLLGSRGDNNIEARWGTIDITLTTGSSGKGAAHENRPPYYALYFIMKL